VIGYLRDTGDGPVAAHRSDFCRHAPTPLQSMKMSVTGSPYANNRRASVEV